MYPVPYRKRWGKSPRRTRFGDITMSILNEKRMFPCPVCTSPCQVKITKKDKPYIVCDPCGVQLFVRGPSGITAFERLIGRGNQNDVWTRIKEMEQRYRLKCPECGYQFWIESQFIETSAWDGSLKGFRCQGKNCDAIVPWEKTA
jgi:transcription elongation factor Elf1